MSIPQDRRDLAFEAFLQKEGAMDFRTKRIKLEKGQWPQVEEEEVDLRKEMDDQFADWLEMFNDKKIPGRPQRDKRLVYIDAGNREQEFQDWYSKWAEKADLDPDPNPDLHKYDYRKAFLAGEEPTIDETSGEYHWPSRYKYRRELEGEDHPTRFVGGVDRAPLGIWEQHVADRNYVESGPKDIPTIGRPREDYIPIPKSLANEKSLSAFESKSKNYFKQLNDVAKYFAANPGQAIPGRIAVMLNDMVKAVTLDRVDILAASNWIYKKIGAPPAWDEESEREFMREKMGYVPEKFLTGQKLIASLPSFLSYGAILKSVAGVAQAWKVPAFRALAQGTVGGVITGLLKKPEDETLKGYAEQIGTDALLFAGLNLGLLSVDKLIDKMEWYRTYGDAYKASGGRPSSVTYTRQQVYDLRQKIEQGVPLTAEETSIVEEIKAAVNGWSKAMGKSGTGWIHDTGVPKFPRKPRVSDIFRNQERIPQYEGEPLKKKSTAGTSPGAVPQPPAPETEPPVAEPPGERPATPLGAGIPEPTAAPPEPVPVTPPGPPKGLPGFGMRMGENVEKRRVIDVALGALKGTPADPVDLERARAFLEHEKHPGIGNAQLVDLQERHGVNKYFAIFDLKDMRGWNNLLTHQGTDDKVLAQIAERLAKFNTSDNPLEWKASRWGGDEYTLTGDSPNQLIDDIENLKRELRGVVIDGKPIEIVAGYGTSVAEADKNFYDTKRAIEKKPEAIDVAPVPTEAGQPIYHYTNPKAIGQIFDQGFNTKLPALFGYGATPGPLAVKGRQVSHKPARGTLFFTRDPNRYKTADVFVGEGKGDKDYRYFDKEKRRWITVPKSLRTIPLEPIEATLKSGSNTLILDSLDKYIKFKGDSMFRNSLKDVVRKAKKEGYDALEIKHVPGQWERPGYTDRSGGKDLYYYTTGSGGEDDFFVFNRDALNIPAMKQHRVKRMYEARARASMKRGLVGWPKGKVKLWDDIHRLTSGKGLKPEIGKSGKISEEFSQNVPRFMWNKNGLGWDDVQQMLVDSGEYQFLEDDLRYRLGTTLGIDYKNAPQYDEGEIPQEDLTEEEMMDRLINMLDPILTDAERANKLEGFYDRMQKEALESGFGDDVQGYIDNQLQIRGRNVGEGEEPAFKIVPKEPVVNEIIQEGILDKDIIDQQIKDGARPEDGPDYAPTIKKGEKRIGGYGVDAVRAWFNEGKLKYPYVYYLGDVSIRELLQNSLDAIIEALEKGEITEGILGMKYADKFIYFVDNGIGMSDDDIADKFLMLHATGKAKIGRFGGMGIAKAVILAPDPTSTWTLHTRDNWYTHEMTNRREEIATRKKIQGTRILVKADHKFTSKLGELYVLTTKLPANVRAEVEHGTLPAKNVKTRTVALPLGNDLFKNMKGSTTRHTVNGNEMELTYYPVPEIDRNMPHLKDDLNGKKIIRLIDDKTGARLTQHIEDAGPAEFKGILVIDIRANAPAGSSDYPLTDSRMDLKWNMADPVREVTHKFTVDKVSALRAGVEKKPMKLSQVSPQWNIVIQNLKNNPAYKRLVSVIKEIYKETNKYNGSENPTDPFLPLEKYIADIDEGYDEGFAESPYVALVSIAYDALMRMCENIIGAGYKVPKFLFSKTIDGTQVESSWLAGVVGFNPVVFTDKTATKGPDALAELLFTDVAHETAHQFVHKHGQEHEMYQDKIKFDLIEAGYKNFFLDLAEAIKGKPSDTRFHVRSWINLRLPSGRETKTTKAELEAIGQKQLDFNKTVEEKNGPADTYKPEGEPDEKIRRSIPSAGLPEGTGRRDNVRLPGEGGGDVYRGGSELESAYGDVVPDKEGLGIRQVNARGEIEPSLKVTRQLRLPSGQEPQEIKLEKSVSQVGEEPLTLEQKVKAEPKPKEEVLKEIPKRESFSTIFNEVKRLTTGKNFPSHWRGNSPEEIDDNRQNLVMYAAQNYDPTKGPLENFINSAKRYFYKGRDLSTMSKEERENLKRIEGLPEGVEGSEVIEGKKGFMYEPGTEPIHKRQEPILDEEALEASKASEDERITQIFRQVAQDLAGSPAEQANLYGQRVPSQLENNLFEIMAARLIDVPETYEQLAARLGMKRSTIQEMFENKVMPALIAHPEIVKMLNEHYRRHPVAMGMAFGPMPTPEQIKDWVEKIKLWTSPTKGVNKETDRQNDLRIGYPHAQRFLQVKDAYQLKEWLDEQPAGTSDHVLELLTGQVSGTNGYDDIINSTLPPNIKDLLLRTRARIDMLSNLLMINGAPPQSVHATMQANLGTYIERKFRLYESKKWLPNDQQKAGFKRLLMNPHANSGMVPLSSEEADAFIDETIRFARLVKRKGGLANAGVEIPQDSYIHKLDLSPEWREFAGEILDPLWLMVDTVTRQATGVASARMLNWIAGRYGEYTPQNLDGVWSRDRDQVRRIRRADGTYENWMNNLLPDLQRYGQLRNTYVSHELWKYIMREFNPTMSEFNKLMQRLIVNPYKLTKTALNIPTHARNTLGNTMLSVLQGTSIYNPINWKYYKKSLWAHFNRMGSSSDEWARLIQSGFSETGYYGTEIPRIVESIMRLDDPSWVYKLYDKVLQLPIDKLLQWYNFEDSWFRVAGHYHNEAKGMSLADDMDDINMSYPNYRKLPIAAEFLRKVPIFGPWVSFRWNMMQIGAKQLERAVTDMNTPGKIGKGWARFLKFGLLAFLPSILSELSKRLNNVDSKQVEQLEKYMTPWQRHGSFIYFRGKDGKLKALDLSYVNPFGEFERTIKAAFSGDLETMYEGLDFLQSPLLDAWQILAKGRDPRWGTEYDNYGQRLMALVQNLYLPASSPVPDIPALIKGHFGPGITVEENPDTGEMELIRHPEAGNLRAGPLTGSSVKSMYDAWNNNPNEYGKIKTLSEEMKNFFTGLRSWDVNPDEVLLRAFKNREIEINKKEARLATWMKKNLAQPDSAYEMKIKKTADKILELKKEQEAIAILIQDLANDNFLMRGKH